LNDKFFARMTLQDPGELIAAIPYLVGFHPTNSLAAVLLLSDENGTRVAGCGLATLPTAEQYEDCAVHTLALATCRGANAVMAVVISDNHQMGQETLPYRDFIEQLDDILAGGDVELRDAVWCATTTPGSPWACYVHPDGYGDVPPPEQTPVAAASVAAGLVTFANERDLVAALEPDEDELLDRRIAVIERMVAVAEHSGELVSLAGTIRRAELVRAAVAAAADERFEPDDVQLAELAIALTDDVARDIGFGLGLGGTAGAAEVLWRCLIKALPAPFCAVPAVLLAACALTRGDGVTASIAVGIAGEADPDLLLARLLRVAIDFAIEPAAVADVVRHAAAAAERFLADIAE
jgi:Domain of unknown function (DUF4192)